MRNLREEICSAINRSSAENGSDTPDFILAQFLTDCLTAFDTAVNSRDLWYGRGQFPTATKVSSEPGNETAPQPPEAHDPPVNRSTP